MTDATKLLQTTRNDEAGEPLAQLVLYTALLVGWAVCSLTRVEYGVLAGLAVFWTCGLFFASVIGRK
jgi:hypothetical protein